MDSSSIQRSSATSVGHMRELTLTIRLSTEERARLAKVADRLGIDVAPLIRMWIKEKYDVLYRAEKK